MEVDCKSTGSAYVGSNPTLPIRSNSSEVEHLLYTEIVGGSIPSSSISIFYTMNKQKIKDQLQEIKIELAYMRGLLVNVSNQVQELREATGVTSNKTEKLSVPKLYEHPWYKYKREQLVIDRNCDGPITKPKEDINL